MVDGCSIRRFAPADLKRLHDIRAAAYQPVFRSFRELVGVPIAGVALANLEQEQADYLDTLCGPNSDREVYVVEEGGRIVGFYAVALNGQTKVGELDLNAVDPDCQGRGIGSWMFGRALDRMKEAGMKAATVGTGGDASHAPARRAYEKAGFGPSIPSVYMYRTL
ncbi:GNAT family N-acetyltransferase [Bauldia sp.]|uniref:GNAT family N-acetyltransferase n=1 Tax=Bauldia sp. TaxID=2575872 RepID=UPI003BAB505F